jgi:hypothetical protein
VAVRQKLPIVVFEDFGSVSVLTPSLASQLLQFIAFPCRSWLASEEDRTITAELRPETFPAPTPGTPLATGRFFSL